ncbi:hypothetical protein [Actinoplanes sp. GCM10030250]|uniref:hypothetical protein n=1 Tax=Actinoplanes sp. GCM10030250 TaxID=3273376 RepID=UPI003615A4F9
MLEDNGLNDLDVIWNQACDYGAEGEVPEGTPTGVEHLASLLRVYNSAMGGGLGFALEVNEPFRVRNAINALRYFELAEAADFLQDVLDRSLNGESPDSLPSDVDFYDLVDDETGPVRRAFKAKAAEIPTDFGCD